MNAITVRNLPPEVARAIQKRAKSERLSLNRAVVKLLAEATGLAPDTRPVLQHDLDEFAGSWTDAEADELDACIREQRTIDPETWK
jgi:plasmid stability protein